MSCSFALLLGIIILLCVQLPTLRDAWEGSTVNGSFSAHHRDGYSLWPELTSQATRHTPRPAAVHFTINENHWAFRDARSALLEYSKGGQRVETYNVKQRYNIASAVAMHAASLAKAHSGKPPARCSGLSSTTGQMMCCISPSVRRAR